MSPRPASSPLASRFLYAAMALIVGTYSGLISERGGYIAAMCAARFKGVIPDSSKSLTTSFASSGNLEAAGCAFKLRVVMAWLRLSMTLMISHTKRIRH